MIALMLIINVLLGLLGGFVLHLSLNAVPEMWRAGWPARGFSIMLCAVGLPAVAFGYWMLWYQTILIWTM